MERSGLPADFHRLWAAQAISQLGTQVSLLAIPLIGAIVLQASPFEFALLGAFEFAPFVLFSLPAGVLVDRLPSRAVLVVTDVGRALLIAAVPAAYALDVLALWQLYLVGFLSGTLTVFFEIAYLSCLPAIVSRDQLVTANARLEVSRSAAQVAGPGVGGLLVGALSAPVALLVDAGTYLASAMFVLSIGGARHDSNVLRHATTTSGLRAATGDGIKFVAQNPYLRAIVGCTAISNLFSTMVFSIVVLYFVRELTLTPETIGALFAVGNVGLLVGALAAGRVAARIGLGRAIVGAALLFGPSVGLLALAPRDSGLTALALIAGALFVGSFAQVVYNVNQISLRQAVTPRSLLGRMNATMRFVVWGAIPVGQISAGLLGQSIGLWPTIAIGAVGGLFAFVPVLLSPVRNLVTLPEPATESRDLTPSSPDTSR